MNIVIEQNDWSLLQNAIDQVSSAGGGKVTVACNISDSHTIFLKDNVELHLAHGSGITGSEKWEDYTDFRPPELGGLAPEKSNCTLLAAVNARNIAVTGPGTLACPGQKFYDTTQTSYGGRFYAKPLTPRPRILHLVDCSEVHLSETLYLNSPCWTIWLCGCDHVTIRGIRIDGDQMMINNDGIDIDSCRDVTVSDCNIKTADDCLVLRAMPRGRETPDICENVVVTNCILNSACQGIRVGCPSDDTIRNCRFSNLIMNCPGNGIHIDNPKHYLRRGCNGNLALSDIFFSHITLKTGWYPLRINVEEGIRLRALRNIVFDDLQMESATPCCFTGSSETLLDGITLRNSTWIRPASTEEMLIVRHCRRLNLDNFELREQD